MRRAAPRPRLERGTYRLGDGRSQIASEVASITNREVMLGDSNFSKSGSTSPQYYHACRHVPHRSALSVLYLCYRHPGSYGVLLLC